MGNFIDNVLGSFIQDPLFYMGILFAALAMFGLLIFIRGFISGAGYVLTNTGHEDHQEHAQTRAIWGVFVITAAFMLWELLKGVLSVFGYGTASIPFAIGMGVCVVVWIFFFKSAQGEGH